MRKYDFTKSDLPGFSHLSDEDFEAFLSEYVSALNLPDFSKYYETVRRIIDSHEAKIYSMLEAYTREFAKPTIKGELTAGKLIWRGIRIISKTDGYTTKFWVDQRGEKISPTFFMSNFK